MKQLANKVAVIDLQVDVQKATLMRDICKLSEALPRLEESATERCNGRPISGQF